MIDELCAVGCGAMAAHMHHCIYEQELRRRVRASGRPWSVLLRDARNLIPLCFDCHGAHHNRTFPVALSVLPDSVYEFARELMGPGAAYEYLIRLYGGTDARADQLLADWEAAA